MCPDPPARDREHVVTGQVRRSVIGIAAQHRPTDEDHRAIDIALSGLAHGDDLGAVAARLEPLHPRHKSKFALRAAAMLNGGVDPGLLDEVQWWRTDDVWYWALDALAVYARVAAERTNETVESVCRRLADGRRITLA